MVDLVLTGDVPGLPTRCLQVCDPARPHTLVPMPAPRFRFEFMLLPGESEEEIRRADMIDELMSAWIDPHLAEVERSAVYTFHGLVASTWRDRRVLLAGDAAHQTPPFLGQGMCAGLRDAANLAWKLAAVIDGSSPDALLDTYQVEREPHAQAVIDAAVGFGQLICLHRWRGGPTRDDAMLADYSGESHGPRFHPAAPRRPGHRTRRRTLSRAAAGRWASSSTTGWDPASCWHPHPLDPTSPSRPVVVGTGRCSTRRRPRWPALLEGSEACVIRPDRYVMARGGIDEVTAFAATALGSKLSV